ncbi:MAG TPA: TetR/AcrR family transcriptional regulator [Flavisolibacter sp.]|jgi:AcrR family transcriptional regulator|nr:TetR/AcrR family transcriptional regulator [Flavisolibacter sp.]
MGELILIKARELFFSYGLRSVSMDDLAKLAGISKKTIYQSFEDKSALVNRIVEDLIDCHYQLFQSCQTDAADAIDEVFRQSNAPFETWASVTPGFFYELEKFFPEAWRKLEEHRDKVMQPGIVKNLERGQAEGLYREEMNIAFIADLRIHQLINALQPTGFMNHKISVSQLMKELTIFYLHGITTEKGKKRLTKYLKNSNENK